VRQHDKLVNLSCCFWRHRQGELPGKLCSICLYNMLQHAQLNYTCCHGTGDTALLSPLMAAAAAAAAAVLAELLPVVGLPLDSIPVVAAVVVAVLVSIQGCTPCKYVCAVHWKHMLTGC
jgi:hypothetical protein